MSRKQIPFAALTLAAAVPVAMALTACVENQLKDFPTTADGTPQQSAAAREYADCWTDVTKRKDASPPARTFDTADAAMLRCRHLQPGPDHCVDHYKTGGRFPVPRHAYSVADHQRRLIATAT